MLSVLLSYCSEASVVSSLSECLHWYLIFSIGWTSGLFSPQLSSEPSSFEIEKELSQYKGKTGREKYLFQSV